MTFHEALAIVLLPAHLRKTLRIALAVGTILTVVNQADVILTGHATLGTVVKTCMNYLTPLVVSNLGLLAGKRAERESKGLG